MYVCDAKDIRTPIQTNLNETPNQSSFETYEESLANQAKYLKAIASWHVMSSTNLIICRIDTADCPRKPRHVVFFHPVKACFIAVSAMSKKVVKL